MYHLQLYHISITALLCHRWFCYCHANWKTPGKLMQRGTLRTPCIYSVGFAFQFIGKYAWNRKWELRHDRENKPVRMGETLRKWSALGKCSAKASGRRNKPRYVSGQDLNTLSSYHKPRWCRMSTFLNHVSRFGQYEQVIQNTDWSTCVVQIAQFRVHSIFTKYSTNSTQYSVINTVIDLWRCSKISTKVENI
jgi:hypothetical protein